MLYLKDDFCIEQESSFLDLIETYITYLFNFVHESEEILLR